MKNDTKIFRLNGRPEGSVPHKDHHTRLIEYDDWMRLDEKKYSRLLAELNRFRWLAQYNINLLDSNNVINLSESMRKHGAHKKNACILRFEKRKQDEG